MTCPSCKAENPRATPQCSRCGHVLERTIPAGTVVAGRFEVRGILGRGGMSVVYDAYDRERREPVALKVMQPDIGALPEMERRFATEIPMAGRIRQANVCRIFGCGEADGFRYIAMEKVDGDDLAHVIARQGGFPVDEAFDIAIQIGRGVQALHAAGIVHRDIKPKNIMYGADGRVRLMDFDIAKHCAAGDSGEAEAGFGTPEYASPEQACGGAVDFRADVYSLGIVVFELFTGAVPFRAATSIETVRLHLRVPVPLEGPDAPPLPQPVIPVLRKALAKSADDRYKTARGLVEALRLAHTMTRPDHAAPVKRRPRASSTDTTERRRTPVDPALARAIPALLSALNERDETVRWTRAVNAAPLDPTARDAIRALLETLDGATHPRPAAVRSNGDAAIASLVESLEHGNLEDRLRATNALAEAGASAMSAMPALLQALEDDSAEVRRTAANALSRIVAAR